ncbi:MAG TPA: hypothetical protein VGJ04_05050, partial [Pirellulales bacterium]
FTATLAVVTSRDWRENNRIVNTNAGRLLRRLAVITPVLAYAQLALGAHLRHFAPDGSPLAFQSLVMWHLTVGLILAAWVVGTAIVFWRKAPGAWSLLISSTLLVALVGVQLALGGATWIVKYGWPAFLANSTSASTFTVEARSWWQAQITTAHVATGSLILAVSTALAVFTCLMVNVPVALRWQQQVAPQVQANSLMEAAV